MAQLRVPEVEAAATAAEFARNLRRLVEWKINVGSIVPMVRRGGLRKSSKDSSNQRADVLELVGRRAIAFHHLDHSRLNRSCYV